MLTTAGDTEPGVGLPQLPYPIIRSRATLEFEDEDVRALFQPSEDPP